MQKLQLMPLVKMPGNIILVFREFTSSYFTLKLWLESWWWRQCRRRRSDINRLMKSLNLKHNPTESRLFIASSTLSLKSVLPQNGICFPPSSLMRLIQTCKPLSTSLMRLILVQTCKPLSTQSNMLNVSGKYVAI